MEAIAMEAGDLIKKAFHEDKTIMIKNGDTTDLVTETDRSVESFVRGQLHQFRPDWEFIGEETSSAGVAIPDEPVWVVDPIDGTTNFVHRFPEIGVSIALVVGKKPVVGVIYNPVLGRLLTAARGHGAFLNGSRLVLDTSSRPLNKCFVLTHFMNFGNRPQRFYQLNALLDIPVHAIRLIGCATMNMAYVATGTADVYFERGLKCWDMAAGIVIIREAGGVAIDYTGGETFDLSRRECIVARNMDLAKEILSICLGTEKPADN